MWIEAAAFSICDNQACHPILIIWYMQVQNNVCLLVVILQLCVMTVFFIFTTVAWLKNTHFIFRPMLSSALLCYIYIITPSFEDIQSKKEIGQHINALLIMIMENTFNKEDCLIVQSAFIHPLFATRVQKLDPWLLIHIDQFI